MPAKSDGRRITRLDNGAHVITDNCPTAETLSVDVSFRVGSCDEGDTPHGIAHFMEHMAFKGTERRTAEDIHSEIGALGGDLNATTDQDTTSFTCVTLKGRLAASLDVLADIVTEPRLSPDDVDTERKVILQELEEGRGTWATMHECFYGSAYGEQALARPIIGTADGVEAVSATSLRDFLTRHYVSGNLAVAVAGDVDHAQACDVVAEKFASLTRGAASPMPSFEYIGGEQGFACSCEHGIVRYGFSAPHSTHPDYAAVALFSAILGNGPSARFTRELREKRGLVYGVQCDWAEHCGTMLTWFETQNDVKHIRDILFTMHDLMTAAATDIGEVELRRTQQMLEAWRRMSRDNMQERTRRAIQEFFAAGALEPLGTWTARHAAVDVDRLRAAAAKHLAGAPTLAVHGPARGMPKLAMLAARGQKKAA